MNYDVFIPTAGLGTRLNVLSQNINKSLLPINHKPVISHIIEKFPAAKLIHIAIGFKGNLVKDYLEITYPEKKFNFIKIKNFQGKGSGLGLTLINSINHINRPFYFVSCDTFIDKKIDFNNFDWLAFSKKKDLGQNYRHLRFKKNKVIKILEKKERKIKGDKIYIGLAFVKNYKTFKIKLRENKRKTQENGEVAVFNDMIKNDFAFKPIEVNWHDTGNLSSYLKLKKNKDKLKVNILQKTNEQIWFVNKKVIKFSQDQNFIKSRVIRANNLKNVPKIINSKRNYYCYKFLEGRVFSEVQRLSKFKDLLDLSKKFWKIEKLNLQKNKKFIESCENFYKNKTLKRINQFYRSTNIKDQNFIINNKKFEKLSSYIKKIKWDELSKGIPSRFHGDYHFENIIFNQKKNKFTFLDWRQDFNGIITYGDLYYDLGKLMHGIIVSHEIVNKNKFKILIDGKKVKLSISRKKHLVKFEKYFVNWIKKNNFSLKKVYLITSLIYLNIAPLHHNPYNKFLYFFGIYMLRKSLGIKNDT